MTARDSEPATEIYHKLRRHGSNPVSAAVATPFVWLTVCLARKLGVPELPESAKERRR